MILTLKQDLTQDLETNLTNRRSRPVAVWLLVGVAMLVVQIILGGITRLTDSGLSITEWKPLLGAVPPTSEAGWNEAFNHYKQIAQYKQLHSYFTLSDFKAIFFWEWAHRLWARLIGVVFIIPFVVFLIQKRFKKSMINPLVILFLLGGLQGLIGWLMVVSGLNDENLYVSHLRLAVHFISALVLLCYTFWFALKLLVPAGQKVAVASNKLLYAILAVLVVQLAYGAFMAGLKAAATAPTWPDINGNALPLSFTTYAGKSWSVLGSLANNPLVVQFIHRSLAYGLAVLIFIWTAKAAKQRGSALYNRVKWLPALLVVAQMVLGIAAVLTSIRKVPQQWGGFEWMALAHQATAMLLLLSLVMVYYLSGRRNAAGSAAVV